MILDKRSDLMLTYEKARAKLVEFEKSKEEYPEFPLESDDLIYSTIFVLSKYCEELIEGGEHSALSYWRKRLEAVSQYYDATVKAESHQNRDDVFLILGAAAYFLLDNFGSAKVLVSRINSRKIENETINLLLYTFYYLLGIECFNQNPVIDECIGLLKEHFERGGNPSLIIGNLLKRRDYAYHEDSIIDVNFIDILIAVNIVALSFSAWKLLPESSDLDVGIWSQYIKREKAIRLLWPAQKVLLEAGILKNNDIVVPLPTGVGKTKSIEILLRDRLLAGDKCKAIVIAPLRALCNEITTDLTQAMGEEILVNQFSDTMQLDITDIILNLNEAKQVNFVFVCTPEKFAYLLRREPLFLETIELYIFDEAHLFDDISRGASYEMLVSEVSRKRKESAQIVLFSAVLKNANEIKDWLFGKEGKVIDSSLVKSTEKSIGFLSSNHNLYYYEKSNMQEESYFIPNSVEVTELNKKKGERKLRYFPEKSTQDYAIYYASKLCTKGGTAIFVGQPRSIEPTLRRIVNLKERGYDLNNIIEHSNSGEHAKFSELFERHYGEQSDLTKAVALGVFPHYSNLPNGIKLAVEHGLRLQDICVVVCTTTLAEGVNIPLKYLFLTTFSYGRSKISIRKIQNMVGRTARSGVYTEGSTIITDFNLYDNKSNTSGGGRHHWNDSIKMFEENSGDPCSSAILFLVSNITIGFDFYFEGESIVTHLVNYYNNGDCFESLVEQIKSKYTAKVDSKKFEKYSYEIKMKVTWIEEIVKSIENYLCFLRNATQDEEKYREEVLTLVVNTFAYYLSENWQKRALVKIFDMIATKVIREVAEDDEIYYAKSLYGIDVSSKILTWVEQNVDELVESPKAEILSGISKLFFGIYHLEERISLDKFLKIVSMWSDGSTYIEIVDFLQDHVDDKMKMISLEKLCSNTISYDLSFLIGTITDALDLYDNVEDLTVKLEVLQKNVKYGVSTAFQIFVCENLFDDKVIAREIDEICNGKCTNAKEFLGYLKMHKEEILELLHKYPSYFLVRFQWYINHRK